MTVVPLRMPKSHAVCENPHRNAHILDRLSETLAYTNGATMVIALIIFAWILTLVAVAGLCAAARAGDRQQQDVAPGEPAWELPRAALVVRHDVQGAVGADLQPDDSLVRSAA
jgi:hypothetical protein